MRGNIHHLRPADGCQPAGSLGGLAGFLFARSCRAIPGCSGPRPPALREQYREKCQAARAAARLLQAVDLLFARPLLTARQVGTALDVNFPTAQRYISQLEQAGLLRELTGKSRNRIYWADEVMRIIEEPLSPPNGEARR
jgi:hypothetical protein